MFSVCTQVRVSIIVSLAQVSCTLHRRKPDKHFQELDHIHTSSLHDFIYYWSRRAYLGGFVSDLQEGKHSTRHSWLGSTKYAIYEREKESETIEHS